MGGGARHFGGVSNKGWGGGGWKGWHVRIGKWEWVGKVLYEVDTSWIFWSCLEYARECCGAWSCMCGLGDAKCDFDHCEMLIVNE
jgi:hypothetical protein